MFTAKQSKAKESHSEYKNNKLPCLSSFVVGGDEDEDGQTDKVAECLVG